VVYQTSCYGYTEASEESSTGPCIGLLPQLLPYQEGLDALSGILYL